MGVVTVVPQLSKYLSIIRMHRIGDHLVSLNDLVCICKTEVGDRPAMAGHALHFHTDHSDAALCPGFVVMLVPFGRQVVLGKMG